MNRLLLIFPLLVTVSLSLVPGPALAGNHTYYNRVWNAHTYRWDYVAVEVEDETPQVYHYEYHLNYSQPASLQGATIYGAQTPVLDLYAYTDGDLGQITDAYSRLTTDRAKGLDKVTTTIQTRNELVSAQNRTVANAAFLDKLAVLVDKINKNELSLSVGSNSESSETTVFSQGVGTVSSSGLLHGPLTIKYCGTCHGEDGDNKDKFSLLTGPASVALAAVLDRKCGPSCLMPKGTSLTAEERLKLAAEFVAHDRAVPAHNP